MKKYKTIIKRTSSPDGCATSEAKSTIVEDGETKVSQFVSTKVSNTSSSSSSSSSSK
ncbi:hypothetical protein [Tychonema sp. BBK16]|uniref:hypothetical protein n=1 Tax=Tychonema sp. BBK16 TaxID=2699888 RepID=UPI0038D2B34F